MTTAARTIGIISRLRPGPTSIHPYSIFHTKWRADQRSDSSGAIEKKGVLGIRVNHFHRTKRLSIHQNKLINSLCKFLLDFLPIWKISKKKSPSDPLKTKT